MLGLTGTVQVSLEQIAAKYVDRIVKREKFEDLSRAEHVKEQTQCVEENT